MDLDKESLYLMLKLNEVDMPRSSIDDRPPEVVVEQEGDSEDSSELQKCRSRVQDLLIQLQRETNAKQIDLEFVSVSKAVCDATICCGSDGGEGGLHSKV